MKQSGLGVALILALLGSILSSQAAEAASLQIWTCDGIPATIVGTPNSETLRGTPGADVIVAREGDDRILAAEGDDIVCAGKGDDTVYGGNGFDILFGAQGNDKLYAAAGAATTQRADTRAPGCSEAPITT
jgi:Ca2+-binding RTX toxin-like protein